jgi:hypothetical protein
MQSLYSNPEFSNLLKDPENQQCFDCGKTPAQWASVNNAVYLCINCSGLHRGYGVNISYIRSITLDTWNENQMNLMKFGGNKNLRELLELYNIDKNKVDKNILYNSKIMDFYRKYLKKKANNEDNDEQAPSKEDALKTINFNLNNINENYNKFTSVSSENNIGVKDENSFQNLLSNWMNKTIEGTKGVVKKVNDMNIPGKIANNSKNLLDKGTEFMKSEKIQNFAKKTNDTLNYYINFLLGKKKAENENNEEKKVNEEKVEEKKEEEKKIEEINKDRI